VDQGGQRRVRLENWAAVAVGWERAREERERVAAPVTDWLVRELAPKLGDVVLELAAGQGDVGFAVAALLGESGRLIASDFSAAMLEIGRRRARSSGSRTSSSGNWTPRISTSRRTASTASSVAGATC
jgi:SAM-dependent methyltransferase